MKKGRTLKDRKKETENEDSRVVFFFFFANRYMQKYQIEIE